MANKRIIEYATPETKLRFPSDALRLSIVFAATMLGTGWIMMIVNGMLPAVNADLRISLWLGIPLLFIGCAVAGVIVFFAVRMRERFARAQLYARHPGIIVGSACVLTLAGYVVDRMHPLGLTGREALINVGCNIMYLGLVGWFGVSRSSPPVALRD